MRKKHKYYLNYERQTARRDYREKVSGGFCCLKCKSWIDTDNLFGSHHRNHCNFCLWSKHVDLRVSGDRKSNCLGGMRPIGLTFKHEGFDRIGEVMIIHLCGGCNRISINRIAGDDLEAEIVQVFENSQYLSETIQNWLTNQNIYLLNCNDKEKLYTQLFGKS